MLDGPYTIYHALAGGVLIGLASFLASFVTGKIPGISGVCARLLIPATPDKLWRLTFMIGLIAGAGIAFSSLSAAAIYRPQSSVWVTALAALLVGIGTRVGGGCTSGHGVCGIGLGAKDSLIATCTFMAFGILTVYLTHHLIA
ncbi:YeeE/YedE family protein [Verrucomicrobiaceae bacterium 5K15]|uniref:YeeE/YedE family protein n=1 Tax=Oceaniferula flava TaxID=2800421 RepID=A0AAE2VEM2_9BACT|nr:YeeE/YedE thiosulfate transporter family protein [Oceaniferula flavus]MBK1856004.1 YeeE/YedE family protein [Oceaniferula flavus]MBM1137311.1 YeeE/YedE family protein [Oceaniferula flavus]